MKDLENSDGERVLQMLAGHENNSLLRAIKIGGTDHMKLRVDPKQLVGVVIWFNAAHFYATEYRQINITTTKGSMDPEGSAHNSCNSLPLYARWADQRACFG